MNDEERPLAHDSQGSHGIPVRTLRKGDTGMDVERLHRYLQTYGYFPGKLTELLKNWIYPVPVPPADLSAFDERTEQAIRFFQRAHGLSVSGVVDQETLDLIAKPRCGCPDVIPGIADYSIGSRKWPRVRLTYRFANYTAGISTPTAQKAVRRATSTWEEVSRIRFVETSTAGDIVIGWYVGKHGDGSDFDGSGGVLAHAFYPPPNGGDLAGDIHFDDAEKWSDNIPPSGIDLETVALHELGHSLGLNHSSDQRSVMYAYYDKKGRRKLTNDDVAAVRALYGTHSFENVECIDYNCVAEAIAATRDWVFWKDEGTTRLFRGQVINGTLRMVNCIDNNCVAEAIAADGQWLYWKDRGTNDLYRGQVINETLRMVDRIDNNCVAEAIAATGQWIFWKDRGTSNLYRGQVINRTLDMIECIDDNCVAEVITATIAGGLEWLFWKDMGTKNLHRGQVIKGALNAIDCIDFDCVAQVIAAEGDLVFWRDRGTTSLHRGRIQA